jgi:hypothetical protein
MRGVLTDVELIFLQGRVERWIRFGRAAGERVIDRRRRVLSFAPGSVFALVRWQAGDFGTEVSRIDIVRAVRPGEPSTTVPFVAPGGELLLHVHGWPKVRQVLEAVDAVERVCRDAADGAPDHWRHVANRLAAGLPPRAYSRARHSAWLLRKALS